MVKVTKEAVKKQILKVGDSLNKPYEIDNVILEYKLYFENGQLIESSGSPFFKMYE